ncbi:hypothetical protein [Nocardioides euryhalodurans]|uniref:Uncharacterized protein n=1 Tax=Nocardioides euryhalodurans TaxID=2518370 RepID=A0A4V1BDM4_9ACTN|nr:hypothetical protein [Nocardioides euryhalodurans]QBR91632.1 hypothetical protein EXE57_04635 [Nocardioides euryhalodurans]
MTLRRLPTALAAASLVVLLVVSSAPSSAAPRPGDGPRAMWVWDRPGVAGLVDFARKQGVRDLFVSTPGHLASSTDLGWFTTLRTRTASAGIRVHALGAEVWWLDDHGAALAWQQQALATGLFDGVHLDVEPWLHPAWPAESATLLALWADMVGLLADDAVPPVEADVPFWLHEHTVAGAPADEVLMAAADAVTVMSYRDTATGPDSITGVAATALATARRLGVRIRLAVETRDLGDGPVADKQTFFGESRRLLERTLREVDTATAGHPTYAGISVHDHHGWVALPR